MNSRKTLAFNIPKLKQHDFIFLAVGAALTALAITIFKPSLLGGFNAGGNFVVRANFDTGGGRPRGKIGVMGGDNQFHDIEFLLDTGNDVTLITEDAARSIGLDYQSGHPFTVVGVGGAPKTFYMVTRPMKIGTDDPIQARIGVGDTPENLLGYQDIAPQYRIVYDRNQNVRFEEEVGVPAAGSKVAVSSNHDSLETRAVDRRFWYY